MFATTFREVGFLFVVLVLCRAVYHDNLKIHTRVLASLGIVLVTDSLQRFRGDCHANIPTHIGCKESLG